MALIECRDCGKQVSSSAVKCPACGRPIALRRGGKYELAGFLMIVGGIGLAFAYPIAGILALAGFAVFITGRFL